MQDVLYPQNGKINTQKACLLLSGLFQSPVFQLQMSSSCTSSAALLMIWGSMLTARSPLLAADPAAWAASSFAPGGGLVSRTMWVLPVWNSFSRSYIAVSALKWGMGRMLSADTGILANMSMRTSSFTRTSPITASLHTHADLHCHCIVKHSRSVQRTEMESLGPGSGSLRPSCFIGAIQKNSISTACARIHRLR